MRTTDKYDIRIEMLVDAIHKGFNKLGYSHTIISTISRQIDIGESPYTGVNDYFCLSIQSKVHPTVTIDIPTLNKVYKLNGERILPFIFHYSLIPFYRRNRRISKYNQPYYKDLKNLKKIRKLNKKLKKSPLNISITSYSFNFAMAKEGEIIGYIIKRDSVDDVTISSPLKDIKTIDDITKKYYECAVQDLEICTYTEFKNNIDYYSKMVEIIGY